VIVQQLLHHLRLPRSASSLVWLVLCCFPFVVLTGALLLYHDAMPTGDWLYAFDRLWKDDYQWRDVLFQLSEHRPILGTAIIIGLIRLDSLSPTIYLLTLAGNMLSAWLFFVLLRRHHKEEKEAIRLPLLAICVLLSSFLLWFNFSIGALSFTLVFTTFLAALLTLWSPSASWKPLALGAMFCFASSFCLANGLLSWISLLPLILRSKKSFAVSFWLLCFVLSVAVYRINYVTPHWTPSVWSSFTDPLLLLQYFFALSGAVLCPFHALPAAMIGICLWGMCIALFFARAKDWRVLLPWMCLLLFAFCSIAAVSAGRMGGNGVESALFIRYRPFSAFFVCSCICVVSVTMTQRRPLLGAGCLLVMLSQFFLGNWAFAHEWLPSWKEVKVGKICVEAHEFSSPYCLEKVIMTGAGLYVKGLAPSLEAFNIIQPFQPPQFANYISSENTKRGAVTHVDDIVPTRYASDSSFIVRGWVAKVFSPNTNILLTAGAEHVLLGRTIPLRRSEMPESRGWEIAIDLPPSFTRQDIQAWIYDEQQNALFLLRDTSSR